MAASDKKAKSLIAILSEYGGKDHKINSILKEIDELEEQSNQLNKEIDFVDFELNNYESKIINAEIIRENLKVFQNVYDNLKPEEKFDLLHLLIKNIVYYENAQQDKTGKKKGRIKMDLWELPPIDLKTINSVIGFAESNRWRGGRGSNPRPPA